MPGSLPREAASVGHKMQHGSCLTPKTEGEIRHCLGKNVFLALGSGQNQSWKVAPKGCLRTKGP